MSKLLRVSNISQQLGRLGDGLTGETAKAFKRNWRPMCEDMGERLELHVEVDVFGKARTPAGTPWTEMAPATRALYAVQGKRPILGGGPTDPMRMSFKIGAPGNLWRITKRGFVFGSKLSRKGYLVARTFQERFKIPKRRTDEKAAGRVRRFFHGMIGVPMPAPGNQLEHPARRIIAWTPRWIDSLGDIALEWLTRAVQAGQDKATAEVRAVQDTYDKARR